MRRDGDGLCFTVVPTAYLALGSNLGDRLGLLRAALDALERGGAAVSRRSAVYENEAVADEPQPPYLNAVVRVETALPPRALLALALSVEASLGRVRQAENRWAPRTVDIDVLLHGAEIVDEPGLTVPHPRLLERSFVRVPLAEVAEAGLRHPVTGARLDVAPASSDLRRVAEGL
jgi:2-amino-4-hydroxy-6-hydroxymethyldihydropteridine diphosphokinase